MADNKEPPPLFDNVDIDKNEEMLDDDDEDIFASAIMVCILL